CVLKGHATGIAHVVVGDDTAHSAPRKAGVVECEQRFERGRVESMEAKGHGGLLQQGRILSRRAMGFAPFPDMQPGGGLLRSRPASPPAACAHAPAARATRLPAARTSA